MANKEKDKQKEELKKLVVARLEIVPPDKKISIGSKGEFTRDELIEHVEKGDEIGEKITEIQLEYLRLLKEGIFYEQSSPNNKT